MPSSKTFLQLQQFIPVFSWLLILFGNKEQASAGAPRMEDCDPQSCGNGINISYPFWIDGRQPSYCGYPSFMITCGNNSYTPVVQVIEHEFYILNIFYHNTSLVVTATEYFGDCPFPYGNITSKPIMYPLGMSSFNREVFFLRNCSSAHLDRYAEIPCAESNGRLAYYGGDYGGVPERAGLDEAGCEIYVAPVMGGDPDNFTALLRRGWMLNWTDIQCPDCVESGGRCGFNDTLREFICICSDQSIQPGSCSKTKRKKKKTPLVIGASAAAGVLLLLCFVVFLVYRQKRKLSPSSKSPFKNLSSKHSFKDPEMSSGHLQTHLFSYAELQEATNCFNTSNELGDGGFGTVYKGKLKDGRTVAVKRLYENNCRRLEQFMNEIEILSRLRHKNLVTLYGCTSPRSQGLLLVYEFVPNGTVADHLHGPRAGEGILTWPMRLGIAIETADALAYLHSVEPPIVHRDVKTCNILLDGSFHVKVADFGLSRLFPTDVTHVSTAPQGTPGYLDPEYHQSYQLTDKSDVYSFGVVLVELISSKPAIDMTRHRGEINLANLAVKRIQNGELEQLVDDGLGYQSDQPARRMITMVAEVAFRCLQSDGDRRPPIKEVLEALKAIQGEGPKVDSGAGENGSGIRAEVVLMKNEAQFSPDTVINHWASRSTTPLTRNIREDARAGKERGHHFKDDLSELQQPKSS